MKRHQGHIIQLQKEAGPGTQPTSVQPQRGKTHEKGKKARWLKNHFWSNRSRPSSNPHYSKTHKDTPNEALGSDYTKIQLI